MNQSIGLNDHIYCLAVIRQPFQEHEDGVNLPASVQTTITESMQQA